MMSWNMGTNYDKLLFHLKHRKNTVVARHAERGKTTMRPVHSWQAFCKQKSAILEMWKDWKATSMVGKVLLGV